MHPFFFWVSEGSFLGPQVFLLIEPQLFFFTQNYRPKTPVMVVLRKSFPAPKVPLIFAWVHWIFI